MIYAAATLALTLGSANALMSGISGTRPVISGIQMNAEASAKAAWLASLDKPSWGAAAPKATRGAPPSAMPTGPSACGTLAGTGELAVAVT